MHIWDATVSFGISDLRGAREALTLRLGDKDRAKYEAIGESDRFVLKFVKPR